MKTLLVILFAACLSAHAQDIMDPAFVASTEEPAAGGGSSSLLTGLVAYWKLDEASGARSDSVGGQTLTDNNTVTSAAGKVSNAGGFELDNTEYLSHADSATLSLGSDTDFTIACWVKLESKGAFDGGIVVKDNGGIAHGLETEYGLAMNNAGSDRFRFAVGNNVTFAEVDANTLGSPSLATWYFIVAWHDSTANTINIQVNNGTADSAAWSGGTYDGTSDTWIGSEPASAARAFDGLIDEVGFWKRVLTAGERTTLYNSGNGTTYPF